MKTHLAFLAGISPQRTARNNPACQTQPRVQNLPGLTVLPGRTQTPREMQLLIKANRQHTEKVNIHTYLSSKHDRNNENK